MSGMSHGDLSPSPSCGRPRRLGGWAGEQPPRSAVLRIQHTREERERERERGEKPASSIFAPDQTGQSVSLLACLIDCSMSLFSVSRLGPRVARKEEERRLEVPFLLFFPPSLSLSSLLWKARKDGEYIVVNEATVELLGSVCPTF